jgi:hypothetical protein
MPSIEYLLLEPPLQDTLIDELIGFWGQTFETPYDHFHSLLQGAERTSNRTIVYLARDGSSLAATCHLTIGILDPALGGLGEVATAPSHRGAGLARELSMRARNDFFAARGRAIFLGTNNPTARRIYHSLGWRKLAGTQVMCHVGETASPEAFLVSYFQRPSSFRCGDGLAAHRLGLIPLIVAPHDWHILDSNAHLVSTRYLVQHSCMGLYPRFVKLREKGPGSRP